MAKTIPGLCVPAEALTLGVLGNNIYILGGPEVGATVVVDPGCRPEPILEALDGRTLDFIVLTHCHWDHVAGAAALREATGAQVVASAIDTPFIEGEQELVLLRTAFDPCPVDRKLDDGDVLRVFRLRKELDLAEAEAGAYPAGGEEILLEKRYAEEKALNPGDKITVCGIGLTVSGTATTPDYDAPFRSMGDSTVDSANFGTAFVTDTLYDRLAETGKSLQSEEYLYAYRLNGKMTDGELKALLKTFSFDPDAVEDPYFQDYWKQLFGRRDELRDGAEELADGVGELSGAIGTLAERMKGDIPDSLRTMLPAELFDGLDELREAGEDAAEAQRGHAHLHEHIGRGGAGVGHGGVLGDQVLGVHVGGVLRPPVGLVQHDGQLRRRQLVGLGLLVAQPRGHAGDHRHDEHRQRRGQQSLSVHVFASPPLPP